MRSGGRHTEYERGSSIGCGWSMAGVCGTHPWSRIALLSATANLVQFPNFIIFQVGSAWLTKWILAAFLISKSEELRVGPLPQSFETARDSPIICSLHMFLVLLQLDAWYSSFMPMFVPSPVRTSALYAPVSHFASLMLALIDSLVMFWWKSFRFVGEKGVGQTTSKPLHYKRVKFHRVVKDFMIQGGDFSAGSFRLIIFILAMFLFFAVSSSVAIQITR